MTDELKAKAGKAYEFYHELNVVPLEYAIAAITTERNQCKAIADHEANQWLDDEAIGACHNIAQKIGERDAAPASPAAEKKPMTMAEIAQEIHRGNVHPGKVWYLADTPEYRAEQEQKNKDARAALDAVATAPTLDPQRQELGGLDLDLCRQWFDAVQDLNPAYLEQRDYILAKKLYEALGMRVPHSILKGATLSKQ